MSTNTNPSGGLSFFSLLFLLFLGLKLTGYIDWSWWWVTAPLWGGYVAVFSILFMVLLLAAIVQVKK
jgi:hypothetical protein